MWSLQIKSCLWFVVCIVVLKLMYVVIYGSLFVSHIHIYIHVHTHTHTYTQTRTHTVTQTVPLDHTMLCVFTPVQRLGELFRKLWNQRSFKAHVSPHEMLQVRRDGWGAGYGNCIVINRQCPLSARRGLWSLSKVRSLRAYERHN